MSPVPVRRLWPTLVVAAVAWLGVRQWGTETAAHPAAPTMAGAVARAEAAFAAVDARKRAARLPLRTDSPVPWAALLGEEFTPLTTTLGSLQAKEVATNPAWAALLVGWLHDAGVRPGDAVGLTASGSFPGLIVCALAAVQELGARPVLVVSLGSSAYGANLPEATWLDLAAWVAEAGILDTQAAAVTIGGEEDRGEGMLPEGPILLAAAAARHGVRLEIPAALDEAIALRLQVLGAERPAALVNVGGGQAALGRCPHAATLPSGPWGSHRPCTCPERGVLARLQDQGVPVIHLLEVRTLAARHGLDPEPGRQYRDLQGADRIVRTSRTWVVGALLLIAAAAVRIGHTPLG
ncbi:MAG: poly-gamma-glutamate system protein [Candidatus Krumholzibacteriia bacterium]